MWVKIKKLEIFSRYVRKIWEYKTSLRKKDKITNAIRQHSIKQNENNENFN